MARTRAGHSAGPVLFLLLALWFRVSRLAGSGRGGHGRRRGLEDPIVAAIFVSGVHEPPHDLGIGLGRDLAGRRQDERGLAGRPVPAAAPRRPPSPLPPPLLLL